MNSHQLTFGFFSTVWNAQNYSRMAKEVADEIDADILNWLLMIHKQKNETQKIESRGSVNSIT